MLSHVRGDDADEEENDLESEDDGEGEEYYASGQGGYEEDVDGQDMRYESEAPQERHDRGDQMPRTASVQPRAIPYYHQDSASSDGPSTSMTSVGASSSPSRTSLASSVSSAAPEAPALQLGFSYLPKYDSGRTAEREVKAEPMDDEEHERARLLREEEVRTHRSSDVVHSVLTFFPLLSSGHHGQLFLVLPYPAIQSTLLVSTVHCAGYRSVVSRS